MNGLDIYINYLNAVIDNVNCYETDKVSNKDNIDSISNLCRDIDDLSNMDKLYIIATGKPLFFSSLDFITDIVVTDYSLMLENMVESEEIREEITRYCGNLLSQDSENSMSFDVNNVINFDDNMSTISDEISNGVEELSNTARVIFEQQDKEDLEEDDDEDDYTEEIPKYDREEEEDEEELEESDDDFLYYEDDEEESQSQYIDADDLDDDDSEFEDDSDFYGHEEDGNDSTLVNTLFSELSRGKPKYEIEDEDDSEFEDDEDDYYLYDDTESNDVKLNKWDIEENEEDEDIDDDDSYYLEDDEDSETNAHVNKWDMEDEEESDEFDEDYPYSDKNTDSNSDNSYNSYDSNLYYEDMLAEGVSSHDFHQEAWDKDFEEDEDDDEFYSCEYDESESETETLNKWDREDEEDDEFGCDEEFDSDDSDYIAPSKHNNNLGKNGNSDASKKFEDAKIEKSFANQRDFGDNSKNIPDEELLLISGSNNNSEFGNTITTKSSSKSTEEIVAESIVKLSEGVLNIPNSLKNRLKVMKNLVEKDELE